MIFVFSISTDSQTISRMAKFGVEFFYENLVKNYEHDLLNTGGIIIKNRIRVVVEWLNSYDFQFQLAHSKCYLTISFEKCTS